MLIRPSFARGPSADGTERSDEHEQNGGARFAGKLARNKRGTPYTDSCRCISASEAGKESIDVRLDLPFA